MADFQVEIEKMPITPDEWFELVEVEDDNSLAQVLEEQRPADIATLIEQIAFDLRLHIFNLLSTQAAAEVIAELDGNDQSLIIDRIPIDKRVAVASHLASNEIADLLGEIRPEHAETILRRLPQSKRTQASELLTYDEDSAGGIMAKEAISAPVSSTVDEVISRIRETAWKDEDFYIVYLIDDQYLIRGTVSIKDLIVAQPNQAVSEIMDADIIKIHVSMDREEVAGLFMRYDLVAAPVVDNEDRFLGRITHDDVLDVMAEEAEEDIARLSGQVEIDPGERSFVRNLRSRLPWLLLGLLGGISAAVVISNFEGQLARITSLVFFLPLVAAMGGNAGIQTSSVMVRGLATGEISGYGLAGRLAREGILALFAGLICGIVTFFACWFWQKDGMLALVVSFSLVFVIIFSAILGAVVPLVLKRYGMDPALATGPFITTMNDIVGLFIYLAVASMILLNKQL
ncbi:MAG: magnesium transporter [Calditrichaeota bacterium]|nr:magnesium transporter [Calditrichota bacterium]